MSERPAEPDRRAEAPDTGSASRGLRLLVEQQAALRRVATLVARGVAPSEVFAAVARELVHCLSVENAGLFRYEPGGAVLVAECDPLPVHWPVGDRRNLEGDNIPAIVLRTGRAARIDSFENAAGSIAARARELGLRGAVGVPVVVGGSLWGGAYVASMAPQPLPPDTEARMSDFADLVATAVAAAASREQLGELAQRQAALRRVATLVAQGVSPSQVFAAVAEEIASSMHGENAGMLRYEADGTVTIVAAHFESALQHLSLVGSRWSLEGDNIPATVLRTGRTARMDTFDNAAGTFAARARDLGFRGAVAVPIVVDGKVWGLAGTISAKREPLPADTEERIGDFAELVATTIANAATRDELIASRARIVAAADDARRRIERDLHDGAQQRLVSLGLQLRTAEASVRPEQTDLKQQLSGIVSVLTAVSSELREISRGIHPAILSEGGLGPALKTLARRCPVPVSLEVAVERRLPDSVEVAAYYVVAEALTNTAKYARASAVNVCAEIKDTILCVSIQDNGVGGADSRKGSGLIGLKDRVEVLGGQLTIASYPGSGTSLQITIPLPADR